MRFTVWNRLHLCTLHIVNKWLSSTCLKLGQLFTLRLRCASHRLASDVAGHPHVAE